uniref:CAP N-terminal domain-containing protein n=1 Tax=Amphilophus citrinellus TaxID=61819 RepID=A0A3Q0S0Y4_AMPCI
MEGLMQRLERAVTRLEQMSVQPSSSMANGDCVNGIDGGLSQCVEAFDMLMSGPVSDYLNNSRAIGSGVEKHAEMVMNALQTQRVFLKMAATHQEPAQV